MSSRVCDWRPSPNHASRSVFNSTEESVQSPNSVTQSCQIRGSSQVSSHRRVELEPQVARVLQDGQNRQPVLVRMRCVERVKRVAQNVRVPELAGDASVFVAPMGRPIACALWVVNRT